MLSIIVPTYNEAENIEELIKEVFATLAGKNIEGEMIIIDDNSPDGTAELAEKLKNQYPLTVIRRPGKRGLASAVLEGVKHARGDVLAVLDADLSHPPEALGRMWDILQKGEADFVIGSRFVPGGGTSEWHWIRKLASWLARVVSWAVTSVKDSTSGYFMFERPVIEGINLIPRGFKIGLEIIVKGKYQRLEEIPIIFEERESGKSKFGIKEMLIYFWQTIDLFMYQHPGSREFIKFSLVGGSGLILQLTILIIAVEILKIHYLLASVIGFLAAATSNFIGNRRWTFKHRPSEKEIPRQYILFLLVSLFGLGLNITLMYLLVDILKLWYVLGQLITVLFVGVANFVNARYFAFS